MEHGEIIVRAARADDAIAIAGFNEAMALETEGVRLDAATIRAGVRAVVDDPAKGRYFVAERGGRVAGALLITFEWSDWRNATFLWIQSVYVDPAHRRQGVFARLYREVEALNTSPGHCGLRLYMDSENASARRTYNALGMAHRGYLVFETPDHLRSGS